MEKITCFLSGSAVYNDIEQGIIKFRKNSPYKRTLLISENY